MIRFEESDSTRKSINVTVVPSATGVTVSGSVRWFDEQFTIPTVVIPCVYSDDATYRVALCTSTSGPVLVLVEDDALPSGYTELCYLARWRFTAASDTCASVDVHVPRRTLVEDPENPLPEPSLRPVSATPVLPQSTPERTVSRARKRRIRELTVQARALREAGTTFTAMSAAQKAIINELVALHAEVPLAVAP